MGMMQEDDEGREDKGRGVMEETGRRRCQNKYSNKLRKTVGPPRTVHVPFWTRHGLSRLGW
jgi:hypothetical protein